MALTLLQTSHSDFDIVVIFLLYKHPFASITQQLPTAVVNNKLKITFNPISIEFQCCLTLPVTV